VPEASLGHVVAAADDKAVRPAAATLRLFFFLFICSRTRLHPESEPRPGVAVAQEKLTQRPSSVAPSTTTRRGVAETGSSAESAYVGKTYSRYGRARRGPRKIPSTHAVDVHDRLPACDAAVREKAENEANRHERSMLLSFRAACASSLVRHIGQAVRG